MAEIIEIAEAINLVNICFPNNTMDVKRTAEIWYSFLENINGALLKRAVLECLLESDRKFAPGVGEVRGKAIGIQLRDLKTPDPYQAYNEVINMSYDKKRREVIEENGGYVILEYQLEFSCLLIKKAAEMIGWPKSFPTDNHSADRAQFYRVYENLFKREIDEKFKAPLLAALEGEASAKMKALAETK
jgi:hypothetical protein